MAHFHKLIVVVRCEGWKNPFGGLQSTDFRIAGSLDKNYIQIEVGRIMDVGSSTALDKQNVFTVILGEAWSGEVDRVPAWLCGSRWGGSAHCQAQVQVNEKLITTRGHEGCKRMLNMELDLQSLFGLHAHSWILIGWDPATPPPPAFLGSYTRALLVSQDRRYVFVTPCLQRGERLTVRCTADLVWSCRLTTEDCAARLECFPSTLYILKSLLSYP